MLLPGLEEIDAAGEVVYSQLLPTAQIRWPLLSGRAGFDLWLKHENHCLTGSFKVRGGLVYLAALGDDAVSGVCAATRGNYGQSVAFAAAAHGVPAVVVVPEGNSPDKNRAMQALGAELIIAGQDFEESVGVVQELSRTRGLHLMPSFDEKLVAGVGTYGAELFRAVPDLERVYVPIGLGSGICGVAAARNALAPGVEIIGVVAEKADAYRRSFEAGELLTTLSADTLADGLAVRAPNPFALALIRENVSRIVTVSDEQVLPAMGWLFADTHNVAEGAGAAAVAAAFAERDINHQHCVGAVLTGGNVTAQVYARALATLGGSN